MKENLVKIEKNCENGIPEIKELDGIKTLFVDNEPFLVLGGEVHNSASSSLEYMEERVWPCIADLNMNTVVVPVTWELLEPCEGQFDFTLVDGLIDQARANGMHLILLWFGLWKNSESYYIPVWMKKDSASYQYVKAANGERKNIISPICQRAIEKDQNAFRQLMRHIREYDGKKHTVLFVQVENEIGVLGSDRDYSDEANLLFYEEIPESMKEIFHVSGTWEECFGTEAGEAFMAYYYACAVEKIASAGKEEYPIPYYTNVWLKQFPWTKGSYPVGGPVAEVHKIWKVAAPSLFTLAPDIYVPYVTQVMEEYTSEENPLFIPEVRKDAVTAAYCLYAFGKYNAIGYSPFAVEEYGWDPKDVIVPPMEWLIALNIDPSAFQMGGAKECLAATYSLMENIKPLYFKYRGTESLQAFVKKGEYDSGELLHFEAVDVVVSHGAKIPEKPISGGMIIEVEKNCFFVIGVMGKVEFLPKQQDGIATVVIHEEGHFEQGKWIPRRRLNGDERYPVQLSDNPQAFYVEVVTG